MAVSIFSAGELVNTDIIVEDAVICGNGNNFMAVESGGTALNTAVSSGGNVSVYNGGMNSNCTVYSGGRVTVLSGGTVKNITLNKGGHLSVSGTVEDLNWTPCEGNLNIYDGGSVSFASSISGVYYGESGSLVENDVSLNGKNVSGAKVSMFVMDGGTASDISVGGSGTVFVFSGGVLAETAVAESGTVTVRDGGTAENISVSSGGVLNVSSGGTALNIDWVPCIGTVNETSGAYITYASQYSGVYYTNDGQSVENQQSVSNMKLVSGAVMYVMNGGNAENILLNGGRLTVSSGGTASIGFNPFAVNQVKSAAGAEVTYLERDGRIYLGSGSVLVSKYDVRNSDVSVGRNQKMIVYDGGIAVRTYVNSTGQLHVSSGNVQSAVIISGGQMYVSGGNVSAAVISNNGSMRVYGGNLSDTFILSGGTAVISGGTAVNTVVDRGTLSVYGSASAVTVENRAKMFVSSGGRAADVVIDNATVTLQYGAAAENININSDGRLNVKNTAVAAKTVVKGGEIIIESGGSAENVAVSSGGSVRVESGGNVSELAVSKGGTFEIIAAENTYAAGTVDGSAFAMSNGIINSLNVRGMLYVSCGGIAEDTTVSSKGGVRISSGGIHRGELTVQKGGKFEVLEGGIIELQLIDRSLSDGYFINNAALISGAPSYTLKVSLEQEAGTYKIAKGAKEFNSAFTVYCDDMNLGTVNVNSTLEFKGASYTLKRDGSGNLTLTVAGKIDMLNPVLNGMPSAADDERTAVISWNEASDNVGVAGYYLTVNGKVYDVKGTSFTLENLAVGTYIYSLQVYDAAGNVSSSGEEASFYIADIDAPVLNGMPSASDDERTAVISWNEASDNVGVAGYYLTVNGKVYDVKDTSFTLENLAVGTYIYSLQAYDAAGNVSSPGEEASFYIADIDAPVAEGELSISVDLKNAVISWNEASDNVGVAGYILTVNGEIYDIKDTVYIFENLAPGVYNCILHAYDAAGNISVNDIESEFYIADYDAPVLDGEPTVQIDGKTAAISWNEANDNVGTAGYYLTFNGEIYDIRDTVYIFENLAAGTYTYSLQAYDAAGNISFSSAEMNFYIADYDAPVLDGEVSAVVKGTGVTISWNEANDNVGVAGYILTVNGETYHLQRTECTLKRLAVGTYTYTLQAYDASGNISLPGKEMTFTITEVVDPDDIVLAGDSGGVSWGGSIENAASANLSKEGNSGVLVIKDVYGGIDFYGTEQGNYHWQISFQEGIWFIGNDFSVESNNSEAEIFVSNADERTDLFFAVSKGIWQSGYSAQHCGNADWQGTADFVRLAGKNKIIDIFEGSASANVLVLSDDSNGDALFVDDIFSAKAVDGCSRITLIKEIRAGAGDDIIDMTSQRFEYIADNMTVYGGDGNDVIWANSGSNILFGDAGNDNITGGTGDDVIIGGCGDDILHGGGGTDTFIFGGNFGMDEIYQCAGGKIILYFESDKVRYDEASGSYTDGTNSVKIYGDDFEVIIGENISEELVDAGVFKDFVSSEIFEKINITA